MRSRLEGIGDSWSISAMSSPVESPAAVVYRADAALIDGRVMADVAISVGPDGDIVAVGDTPPPDTERIRGFVIPGLPNLHSHAFQRAMAGLAERAGPEGDSFWSWREVMYRFIAVLTPEDVEAVAAQLYVECLKNGYTSVGEFHYLHNDPEGRPYQDPAELSRRILAAAEASGIGVTLLPCLYQSSQFGGSAPTPGQRRFVLDDDAFASLCGDLAAATAGNRNWRLGLAPHSLRAVTQDAIGRALLLREALDPAMPVHIHAAEQIKEVEDSIAFSGRRPVDWLLDAGAGEGWCLIHCTHLLADERARLALSGAVAGLCPTTEANLGDGFFETPEFLAEGGRFGIGSDSNVSTSPVEELRWLEYASRLKRRARNVVETREGASVGASLVERALSGGARALGRPTGAIEGGRRADLVVLDLEHPALLGRPLERLLDAFIFNGNVTPVRDVMVGGRFLVRDRHHVDEERIRANFRRTVSRLADHLP
jgi:formimidoylglutamate deiminase